MLLFGANLPTKSNADCWAKLGLEGVDTLFAREGVQQRLIVCDVFIHFPMYLVMYLVKEVQHLSELPHFSLPKNILEAEWRALKTTFRWRKPPSTSIKGRATGRDGGAHCAQDGSFGVGLGQRLHLPGGESEGFSGVKMNGP